jgi:hypothetical protein
VIAAARQKVVSAKQLPDEDEKTFSNRLTRHAAEAGSFFTEDALISTFVDGLLLYAGNMVRGQVTPKMTFAEVQIHAEQVVSAGRAILLSARYSSRLIPPGVHAVRPKSGIAAMAKSSASSLHGLSESQLRSSMPPVVVATTERALSHEQGSELSERWSDMSILTRGWASSAGSVQEKAAFPLRERNMNCHLCYTPGHLLMDCPLLGNEIKQESIRSAKHSIGTPPQCVVTCQTPRSQLHRRCKQGPPIRPNTEVSAAVPPPCMLLSTFRRLWLTPMARKPNSRRKTRRGMCRDALPPLVTAKGGQVPLRLVPSRREKSNVVESFFP